jgi:uncharacterized protein (TIGR03083 family)
MRQPVVRALDTAYSGITAVVDGLDEAGLLLPSGCRGWSLADLMLHLTLDAQRALVALASPAEGLPDVDSVSYWRASSESGDPDAALAHGQWVRRSAAAFARPSGVLRVWRETAPAAVRAAAAADPDGLITTQGLVLTVPDFLATLVTEAVIHHLDLIEPLPDVPEPAPEATDIAMSTLEGLAGPGGLPAQWTVCEALLKGSGRRQLDATDRGTVTRPFPLLG